MLIEFEQFAESHAADIANAVPVGIAIVGPDGRLLFVNAALKLMTGYPGGELLGQPVEILLPDRHRARHVAERDGYLEAPTPRLMGAGRELRARRRDGSEFPVEVGLRPMESKSGHVVVASMIDISERRRLESSFRAVVDAAPYGMLTADAAGMITMANRNLCAMFGYTSEELLGHKLEMLLPARYRAAHDSHREDFAKAPEARPMSSGRELTGRRKDGREFPVQIELSSLVTEQGPMALAAVVDITRRKRAELLLREANAQLEEFTYVSSHDLRSPIRGIGALLEWIREDLGPDAPEKVTRNLDRMHLRVGRMEQLIEDLLTYAHAVRRSVKFEPIDLSALIREIVEMEPLRPGLKLSLDVAVEPLDGARTPLATVLRNLYSNAIKHHDKAEGHIAIDAHEEGSYCVISIADDGPGVPEAAQARVFRLFQTLTATERSGSGLGLAVAKRLVESHGGNIKLISNAGKPGCIFRVWWPRFIRSDLDA